MKNRNNLQLSKISSFAETNFENLSKKELITTIKEILLPLTNPDEYKKIVQNSLPDLVKDLDNREIAGTAMQQASEEMLLAIVETLKKFNNFNDEDIKQFLKDLQGNLTVVEKIEEGGLSMLSDHSMSQVIQMVKELGADKVLMDIAEIRYQKEKTWKTGLEYSNRLEGSKIERQIQKPKR